MIECSGIINDCINKKMKYWKHKRTNYHAAKNEVISNNWIEITKKEYRAYWIEFNNEKAIKKNME